ncbi:MAG TPA: hypothetical protein VKV26_09710 [Dehalococcoidia bacterium]|nr:hypothetical protein [Dehalococcoidia bacterium]
MQPTCAGCNQVIAPIDEALMVRTEGSLPGERQAFHARCWVWWSEARRRQERLQAIFAHTAVAG